MLDPGTESIITALVSPAIMTAAIGFILKKYLDRQEEAVKNLSEAIKDLQNLRDEHTKTKSAVDAAWRVLNVKRMS